MKRACLNQRLFFAHSIEGSVDTVQWEPLEAHLHQVAELAALFAAEFHAAQWGRLSGRLHDVGKFSEKFQSYLLTANGLEAHIEQRSKVDHATAGAQIANERIPNLGRLIAYIIAGHHGGLADANGEASSLDERLMKEVEPYQHAPAEFLTPDIQLANPPLQLNQTDLESVGFQLAFFTRMVFSCLVDADFLCTERFMSPDRAAKRPTARPVFEAMSQQLRGFLEDKTARSPDGIVKSSRQGVLEACRTTAELDPGLFSLTVPTGGGKTLSSLTFAINHLLRHGKSRIIYGIPFTSIIEQTASVFRDLFEPLGDDIVLEHHSNLDPDNEDYRSRLAAENWDAPLVVTTNVQFFESFFANKTSRCRKLHNIANSVIILDEAQTLPVDRLKPCLRVLDELVRNYRCSIVLCTATQPAIEKRDDFTIGLENVREIVPHRDSLYRDMKRVEVKQLGTLTDSELIDHLGQHKQFLTIVNTRSHAAKLYREIVEQRGSDNGVYHLSTLMCGQHRADIIRMIRTRLTDERPCRVISTQLIEAGVDVDFPVVYRSMTGIDSIAQAAGRCNREGRLPSANAYVFEPADVKLFGYLNSVVQTAQEVAPDFADLLVPEAITKYFDLHYWKQSGENNDWDGNSGTSVMKCFPFANGKMPFNFKQAAERFRMIDNNGVSVLVPYRKRGQKLLEQLRQTGPNRHLLRTLQRYTVNLYEHLYQLMQADVELIHNFPVLINPSAYKEDLGMRIDRPGFMEPGDIIL